MRILMVEDERELAFAWQSALERAGLVVDLAFGLAEGAAMAQAFPYAAVALDRQLPDGDGLGLCQSLRRAGFAGGVLMLTAKDALEDRVAGLNAGADDYLVKPFAMAELVARLHAVARRHAPVRSPELQAGPLRLNEAEGRAELGGEALALSPKEFLLLRHFLRHPGQLLSREQLLEAAWDSEAEGSLESVRVHVKNLRRKLERPGLPPLIRTVHGMGYRLEG